MAQLVLLNKPFQVLSQFRDEQGRCTLSSYIDNPELRVAGRLDYDSEGLLLLTDDGQLGQQIANPRHRHWKSYWVQIEGEADEAQLQALREGLELKDGLTRPARARRMDAPPHLWPRQPPIRTRQSVTDSWLELQIQEGRNRQVRRMTAAVGLPTLRLIRSAVAEWSLDHLQPGQMCSLNINMPAPTKVRKPSPKRLKGGSAGSSRRAPRRR